MTAASTYLLHVARELDRGTPPVPSVSIRAYRPVCEGRARCSRWCLSAHLEEVGQPRQAQHGQKENGQSAAEVRIRGGMVGEVQPRQGQHDHYDQYRRQDHRQVPVPDARLMFHATMILSCRSNSAHRVTDSGVD